MCALPSGHLPGPVVLCHARAHARARGVLGKTEKSRIEGRAHEQGWQIAQVFIERGISGSVPLGDRPEGARLMAMLQPGDIVFRSAWNALNVMREF